jgi:hypothetical protein
MHSSQLSDTVRAFGRSLPPHSVNPDASDQDTQENVEQKRKIKLIFFTFCI